MTARVWATVAIAAVVLAYLWQAGWLGVIQLALSLTFFPPAAWSE